MLRLLYASTLHAGIAKLSAKSPGFLVGAGHVVVAVVGRVRRLRLALLPAGDVLAGRNGWGRRVIRRFGLARSRGRGGHGAMVSKRRTLAAAQLPRLDCPDPLVSSRETPFALIE